MSVLLLLSKTAGLSELDEGAGTFGGGAEPCGLAMPCINRFLKPSTFNDCRLGPGETLSVGVCSVDRHVSTKSHGSTLNENVASVAS